MALFSNGLLDSITLNSSGFNFLFSSAAVVGSSESYGIAASSGGIDFTFALFGAVVAPGNAIEMNGDDTVGVFNTVEGNRGIFAEGGENTIYVGKSGSVSGVAWGIEIDNAAGASNTIVNHGTIIGNSGEAILDDNDGSDLDLTNTGFIQGDVLLLGGDDRYEARDGGMVNGQVYGGIGDDTLIGDSADDDMTGSGGNDLLRGGDGNDTLQGGSGSGTDTVEGGDGDDDISISNGEASGGRGDDRLSFTDIPGGVAELDGGLGDDEFVLRQETSFSNGGRGDDHFSFEYANGEHVIEMGLGEDTLELDNVDPVEQGIITVTDLSDEDTIDLTWFGYADVDDAMMDAVQDGNDVVFTLAGATLVLENTSLAQAEDAVFV